MSLVLERKHPVFPETGTQKIYRFDNDYGASVVQFWIPGVDIGGRKYGSYGVDDGLWELAVVRFDGDGTDSFQIDYNTGITDDVIGYLTEDEINNYLKEIEAL